MTPHENWNARIFLVVFCFIALAFACLAALRLFGPRHVTESNSSKSEMIPSPAIQWADAPADAIAVGGVMKPKEMTEQARKIIDRFCSLGIQSEKQWQAMKAASLSYVGIESIIDPSELSSHGIDLNLPVYYSVLPFDSHDQTVATVLSAGLSNEAQYMAFVKSVADRQRVALIEDDSDQPKVLRFSKNTVLAIVGGRAYVYYGPRDDQLPSRLRTFLREKARNPILKRQPVTTAIESIGGPGDATLYVDILQVAERQDKGMFQALLSDVRSLVIKANSKTTTATVNFTAGSRLLQLLKPSPSPKDFISKIERPLLMTSVNLADPLELSQYVEKQFPQGNSTKQISTDITGLSFAEWCDLLKDGNFGTMFFKANSTSSPTLLFWVKFCQTDQQLVLKAKNSINRLLGLFSAGNFIMSTTTDGYVVFGSAIQQIRALDEQTARKWQPAIGDSDIANIELFPGEIARHLQPLAPSTNPPQLSESTISFAFRRNDNSVALETQTSEEGAAPVATFALIASMMLPLQPTSVDAPPKP